GTFGDIYRSRYKGEFVALKRLRMFRDSDKGKIYRVCLNFCREAQTWYRLQHQYILPFYGVDAENFPRQPCMVSPWMANGTVMDFLEKRPKFNVDKLVSGFYMLYEIAQGIAYLHSQGVVHGDIKGANILIDDGWHPRLADFGLTILVDATRQNSTTDHGGTIRYTAPELLDPSQFGMTKYQRTAESDMYAFACLCIEASLFFCTCNFSTQLFFKLYTHKPPFDEVPERDIILKVPKGKRPSRPTVPPMTDELWKLVDACWHQRPSMRPKADSVVSRLKDILRRSSTSTTATIRPGFPSTSDLMTEILQDGQGNSPETPRAVQAPRRRLAQYYNRPDSGQDNISYILQPIRTHADPTRMYRTILEHVQKEK
ncbi:kinase-like domain-containing protein, partial [Mycena floridula]